MGVNVIYFASYAEYSHHHGLTIGVTESIPDGFKCDRHLGYLAPPQGTFEYWERVKNDHTPNEQDFDLFKTGYRIHFKKVLNDFKSFLEFIEPSEDITFLSLERPEEYSHRNLIATYIQAKFSTLYGGIDTLYKIQPDSIGIGATVTHVDERTKQSQWAGQIVWMHDSRTYADVLWERPEVEEVVHPIYSNKSYNRINRPERFPTKLLKLLK